MDVVDLTKELVTIPSVSRYSKPPNSDFIADRLHRACFKLEKITYTKQGEGKIILVAPVETGSIPLLSERSARSLDAACTEPGSVL